MGCFSKPRKLKASKSESLLAKTAREQYAYYKQKGVPLENYEIADARRIDSDDQRQLSVNRSVNTARNAMPALRLNGRPGSGADIIDFETAKAGVKSKAVGAGSLTHDQRVLDRKSRVLSLGRGISANSSEAMRRSASFGAGMDAAQTTAINIVNGAKLNLAGQMVGTSLGLYGKKKGWFDSDSGTG